MTEAPQDSPAATPQEVAYLHEPYWLSDESDWVKSLLLFFDGIALLVPDYMREQPLESDPVLAQPLAELGLLHRLSPESLVDKRVAEELTEVLDRLINVGSFDNLDPHDEMLALSYSRLGGYGSETLADYVIEELRQRGLAGDSQDGVSVPLHREVRSVVLAILPQLIKSSIENQGLALQPATSRPEFVRALLGVLNKPILPSPASVVSADLQEVAIDLSTIPLDEVLDFRRQHGSEYRAYARDLRRLIRELSPLQQNERDEALADRREALRDEADRLARLTKASWRSNFGSFLLAVGGGSASLAVGDPVGGTVNAASALYGVGRRTDPGTAYTYLFQAQSELSGRGRPRRLPT
jgi:hypothetical protein